MTRGPRREIKSRNTESHVLQIDLPRRGGAPLQLGRHAICQRRRPAGRLGRHHFRPRTVAPGAARPARDLPLQQPAAEPAGGGRGGHQGGMRFFGAGSVRLRQWPAPRRRKRPAGAGGLLQSRHAPALAGRRTELALRAGHGQYRLGHAISQRLRARRLSQPQQDPQRRRSLFRAARSAPSARCSPDVAAIHVTLADAIRQFDPARHANGAASNCPGPRRRW